MSPRTEAAEQEAALVARVAAGSSEALGELYDRFSSLLLALSRRVLGNQQEAEDVLQEVFVQVWTQARRYDRQRSSVSTWLVMITRSRSIDRLRSRQVLERTVQAVSEEKANLDTSPKGLGNVLQRERRALLRQQLIELPDEQRQVLELAFYRGMTQSEIAGATGIPLGTVKTRTLLAMRKLRKGLHHHLGELL